MRRLSSTVARLTALQASKRTGRIECHLVPALAKAGEDRVCLGGHAVTVIEGHFQL